MQYAGSNVIPNTPHNMEIGIPRIKKKRVVVVGGGFGGLTLAKKLRKKNFQVVLIDKNNYHQFPPLIYQVASAGLEFDSISFPFRKLFDNRKDFFFRLAEVLNMFPEENRIETSIGTISYDYLVIAAGATTNFYGNEVIRKHAIPMKSVEEALVLRNKLLLDLEKTLDCNNPKIKQSLLNVAIVGGGATGVEIAGALSEMRRYVIPKDYPDLHGENVNIYLIEGTDRLLSNMSEEASKYALKYLEKMGVKVILNSLVTDYKNDQVILKNGETLVAHTLIWVSGIVANTLGNLPPENLGRGGRIIVNEYNQVNGYRNIFAIGDISLQHEENYPNGHPQVAPVAIQQGKLLANNLQNMERGKSLKPFHYKNQGTLATIGRNKAVADLHNIKLHGFPAWAVWMLVHLRSILGVRNKVVVLINWVWNYITYDQSKRFIIFAGKQKDYRIVNEK